MKILAFVDTHGDKKALASLAKKAKSGNVDVIVCAGDISTFGKGLRALIKSVDLGVPLLIVPGNHEDSKDISVAIKGMKLARNAHWSGYLVEDTLFLGCGGGGFSPKHAEFEAGYSLFKKELSKHKGKTVLITHAPPYLTKLDYIHGRHVGVRSMRKLASEAQPNYWICGHLHENAGKKDKIGKTIVVNPGKKGAVFEL